VAQNSWPSPNHNSRNVTDAEYEQLAARFSDDGVYGDPTGTAVCAAGTGLQVTVRSGVYASVRGHTWYSGSADDTLTISSNTSGQTRNDRVVLRLDRSTWDVRAVVLEGTPGAGSPALTQDTGSTGVYEILLAGVVVPDGATSVTVIRGELYVGSRVRPITFGHPNPLPVLGEIQYETDSGRWTGWNGSSRATLYEDTGELALSAGESSWESIADQVGRRIGNTVTLRISKRRKSTLSRSDSDGSKVAVVPSTLRPITRSHFFACTFSNGATGRVDVGIDGEMRVKFLSGDVGTGHTLTLTMTYLRY
jgi:hypothetical protein